MKIIKTTYRQIFIPKIIIKWSILIFLIKIHDYTKYKFCRSFADLFYWPDGICLDTIVVISTLIICISLLFCIFRLNGTASPR